MKNKLLYIFLLTSTLFIMSCGEDRSGEYQTIIAEDKWIETQMRNIYLWYYDIPAEKSLDFFAKPENFFNTLLSKKSQNGKGDRYSYLETLDSQTKAINRESSYGFDFILIQPVQSPKELIARVIFVLPDSPASKANLKRGDWISKVNGEKLSQANYGYLYNGDQAEFTTAAADTLAKETIWVDSTKVTVTASHSLEDNPFYIDTVYNIGGKNIVYLMYNSFTTGPKDDPYDETYNNQMRSIFAGFKGSNISDFILDLRYNPGGYLSCSQVLSSLLTPADKFGQPYCSLAFNDLNLSMDTTYTFRESLTGGSNLNLNKLYVIVSNLTASASEAVINCLSPYMDVVLIGTKTEGKNVASFPISTSEYPSIILHPIVALVNNSKGESDYYEGIKPKYILDEFSKERSLEELKPLGDTKEFLLKNTISLITTGSMPDIKEETTDKPKETIRRLEMKRVYNSMERKKKNGVLLAPRH